VQLEGLVPETRYRVTIDGADCEIDSSFKTFAVAPRRMNIAAVSCNYTTMRGDTDLWADLRDRNVTPGNVDLLLHLGGQIYGDTPFQQADMILGKRTTGTQGQQRRIKELYRELYRMTWGSTGRPGMCWRTCRI
jgi:phosphodiesterase/alkaline phosphatase D-like protein